MTICNKTQTLLFSFFLLFLTTISTHAADATFSWTANAEPVSGYKIHYGTSSRSYNLVVDVPHPVAVNGRITASVGGLQEGQTYYFAATAYTTVESAYSAEVVYAVPVAASPEPPVVDNSAGQESEEAPPSEQVDTSNPENTTPDSTVSDDNSATDTAQVDAPAQPVNKAPITNDATFLVDQDGIINGQLVAADEDGDVLSFYLEADSSQGTILIAPDGSFTYTASPDASGSDWFTFLATDGNATSNMGTVHIQINAVANDFAMEVGELLVTSDWQHVDFSTEFVSPSVVAKSTTTNDPETGLVAIRNLTNKGFDIRISEWDDADGYHSEEIVSFMAMERGAHQIADNFYGVAQCTKLSGINSFQQVTFANDLPSQPVVISSIVTDNENNAAILRMNNISNRGFSITMQEQESNERIHAEETVCFIAMEKWSGVADNLIFEVGSTEKALTETEATMSFEQQFPTIPFVVADMQSTNGMDTATLGMSNLSATDTTLAVVEEQSADDEIYHIAEVGGYFAIAPMYQVEESANDGLTNAEEPAPATPPDFSDTNVINQENPIVTETVSDPTVNEPLSDTSQEAIIEAINQADPIVTEPVSNQLVDEPIVTSNKFNKKTMSSLISLFSDLMKKFKR